MSFDPQGFSDEPAREPIQRQSSPHGDADRPDAGSRVTAPAIVLIICSVMNLLGAFIAAGIGFFYSKIPPDQIEKVLEQNQQGNLQQMKQAGWSVQDIMNFYIYGGYGSGAVFFVLALFTLLGGILMVSRKSFAMSMLASIIIAVPCISPTACVCFLGTGVGIWCMVTLLAPEVRSSFR